MRPLLQQQQPRGLRRVLTRPMTTTTTVARPVAPPPRAEGQTGGAAGAGAGSSAESGPDAASSRSSSPSSSNSVVRTATTTSTPTPAPPPSFAAGPSLDKAARRFAAGVKAGLSADEMVAMEIGGVPSVADLSPPQREYAGAIRKKLEARAEELAREEAERRAREARNFELGKMLYERGQYRACVEALEKGVEDAGGKGTQLGGECAMWLALGYQALGREEECLDLYRWLEQNHPNKRLRKQAADLRYILEAPKMELSPDERVTVPVISSDDAWKAGGRAGGRAASAFRRRGGGGGAGKGERKPWERDLDVELSFLPDKWYVRVAWAALIVGSGVYGNYVAKQQQQQPVSVSVSAGLEQQQQQQQQQPVPVLAAGGRLEQRSQQQQAAAALAASPSLPAAPALQAR